MTIVGPSEDSHNDRRTHSDPTTPYSDPGILGLINFGVYDRDVVPENNVDLNTGFLPACSDSKTPSHRSE